MDPAQAELEQEMEKTDDFASRTEEEARIKIQVAEETARRVIAEAEQARNTLLRELNETKQESAAAVQKAKQKASDDVAAAKAKLEDEVQRRVRDVEDAYKSIVKAAEDKARASENELEKAQEAAEMTVEEAKEAANEELKAGLAAAEEALAAAEEVAAIEIKAAVDAADALIAKKEQELAEQKKKEINEIKQKTAKMLELAKAETTVLVEEARAKALQDVREAKAVAAEQIDQAKNEAENEMRKAESIAAAKDAVAAAVEQSQKDVASAEGKATKLEAEIEKVREAAAKQIKELEEDMKQQVETVKRETREQSEKEVQRALAKQKEAEERVELAVADANKKADRAVKAAETRAEEEITEAVRVSAEQIEAAELDATKRVLEAENSARAQLENANKLAAEEKKKIEKERDEKVAAAEKATKEMKKMKKRLDLIEEDAKRVEEMEDRVEEAEKESTRARTEASDHESARIDAESAAVEAEAKMEAAVEALEIAEAERDAANKAAKQEASLLEGAVKAARQEADAAAAQALLAAKEEHDKNAEIAAAALMETKDSLRRAENDLAEARATHEAAAEEAAELLRIARQDAEEARADADAARAEAEEEKNRLSENADMETLVLFEKRVAEVTAEIETRVDDANHRAEIAENDLAAANFKIDGLRAELGVAQTELASLEQTDRRTTLDDENIRAQIAAMQIKIERRDEEIKKLQALLGIVPKLEKPPEELGQESIIQRAEARISGQTSMPTAEKEVDPETLEKRQELERLLAELTMLKGEQAQTPAQAARAAMELTGMAPPAAPAAPPQAAGGISMPTPLAPGAQQAVAIEPAMIEPSVASPGDAGAFVPTSTTVVVDENAINQAYWDAYNETLEQRKRQRRVDAEAWAAGQTSVVSSNLANVYHWIGGNPREGDNAMIYNRKDNGLSEGGQLFLHLGYNGWQGEPRQVDMRPLPHDHPSRQELGLDDNSGDWWIAEPVYVGAESRVLDFVFSDGEGKYDNAGGSDYHTPCGDGETVDPVAERVRQLEEENAEQDEIIAQKAGRRAQRQTRARQGFKTQGAKDPKTASVLTDPAVPVAGQPLKIFYRYEKDDRDHPLHDVHEVFVQGGWNRWSHAQSFGPVKMEWSDDPPGGTPTLPALEATVTAPTDAHVMDFFFHNGRNGREAKYDSNHSLDYHINTKGARGSNPKLRIVHVAVEMAPIAKVGGMGDVVTALCRAIMEKGHSVEVILPKYDCMDHNQIENLKQTEQFEFKGVVLYVWRGEVEEVPVVFLQPDNGNFDVGCIYGRGDDHVRFEFFSQCALHWLKHSMDKPDVVHAHDWSTAPVIFARRALLPPTAATVITIHNLEFGQDLLGRALERCTFATTVSPTYSREIADHNAIKDNKEKLVGIRNGIDVEIWDPSSDVLLSQWFDAGTWESGKQAAKTQLAQRLSMNLPQPGTPVVGVVARLTQQKGVHLIKHAAKRTLEQGGQFVLLGSSPDGNVQNDFNNLANEFNQKHPGQSGFVFAFDEPLSHLIYAASDMILVPSMFEPCGLTQLIAMRYGTVPVVRRTGGLRDTVFDVDEDVDRARMEETEPNGYAFDGAQAHDIDAALDRAMMTYSSDYGRWKLLVNTIMRQDWGWNGPAETYVEHYWQAKKKHLTNPNVND